MINFSPIFVLPTLTLFIVFFSSAAAAGTTRRGGRILHQPFFPVESDVPPAASPSLSPKPNQKQQPKQPVSTTPSTPQSTFFPTTVPSPPPPPVPPPPKVIATFPANISDLLFPHPPSTSSSRSHVIVIAVSVSFLSVALIIILATFAYFYRRRSFVAVEKASRADSVRLYPPNTATSDGGVVKPGSSSSTSTSSDFLYLGILPNPPPGSNDETATRSSNASTKISIPGLSSSPTAYQRLDSPELNPLPPLPRQNLKQNNWNSEAALDTDEDDDDEEEEEEFFSPRGSSPAPKDSPDLRHDPLGVARDLSSSRRDYSGLFGADRYGSRSFNSRTASYPSCSSRNTPSNTQSPSPPCNTSPDSLKSGSPEVMMKFPAPSRPPPLPPLQNTPTILSNSSSSSSSTFTVANGGIENQLLTRKLPPLPPPVPPPRFWENHEHDSSATSPILSGPSSSDPAEAQSSTSEQVHSNSVIQERSEETTPRPKLKPLHWDKVRASSDRAMVWDQLKSSSFQLNEEMIETLFMVNGSNIGHMDNVRCPIMPLMNPENRVLDPKKSQNIAILLRALNVTVEEVCEALSQGNADSLGSELLESLLKMAPTKEEERKLRDFKDESPFKLGPAEKFLKAVLDIPFAFKRVDAMLYIANFDSEIEYLQRSFGTLEAACKELRSSRMFLKLLEAVLKTGNRMNVGTNRGDAHAFKLDTLLKLVDVKGKDGKTTLLHFVVQEIVRSEGSQVSGNDPIPKQNDQTSLRDDLEFRKLGLQVVSSLSRELTSVKKAATMDACVLSNEVGKLTEGIIKVMDVVKLSNETERDGKFRETMKLFLKKAEEEIMKIEQQKRCAFGVVKEVTEYFHGDSGKEEAHPLRIFTVVRDFLAVLDQVCREVGKVHERAIYGSGSTRQFSMPANPILVPVVTMLDVKRRRYSSSSDDEGSSLA